MRADQPEIAGLSDRIGGSVWNGVVRCGRRVGRFRFVQQKPQFVVAEADGSEVKVFVPQFRQFGRGADRRPSRFVLRGGCPR